MGHAVAVDDEVPTPTTAPDLADPPDPDGLPPRELAGHLLTGAGAACLVTFFLLEGAPLTSYGELTALVVVAALAAVSPLGRRVVRAGLAVVAVLSAVVLFTPLIDRTVRWLDVGRQPTGAGAVVVLGAGIHCGSGQLSATSMARTTEGVRLVHRGLADELVISDNVRSPGGACPSQAEVTRTFVRSLVGRDAPNPIVLRDMRTTRTEARAVARLQRERGWRRVLVVTSPTHTRRALATFRDEGVDAVMVAADEPNFDLDFNEPSDRVRALAPVVREVAGLVRDRIIG